MYRSYDIIGDLIVVKIPRQLQDNKAEIGHLLLERHPGCRLVLRVVGRTRDDTRVRKLERIAGEGPTITSHREHGATYVVDVSEVFFSPRLQTERMRVARQVQPGERVANLFAGAGCFSILIALRTDATVFSVDKNPAAARCMALSIKRNRLRGRVLPMVGDAARVCGCMRGVDRVILPLPAVADGSLGVAVRALDAQGKIHHYREVRGRECDCLERSHLELGAILSRIGKGRLEITDSRVVRSVGPLTWHVAHDILCRA
jgi:tRNA (guanine37-N1)-methyltransferase